MNVALVFAARELRSGVAGFRVFLACLALGVAALSAAGSTAQAFRQGLALQARAILGGDLSVTVEGRRFTARERRVFDALGRTSDILRVRAMAQGAGEARRLVEVRGVDGRFPLAGEVTLSGAPDLAAATSVQSGLAGAAVEPALLDRLHLRLGDRFLIGDRAFAVRAVLVSEPDRLGRGFALGPAVIVRRDRLDASGLIEADSLFGETVRIAFPPGTSSDEASAKLHRSLPDSVLRIRGRKDATAGLGRLIDQLDFFLSFIGLAALLAGGLGVSSAVSAYLERRKPSIAVLKVLGAQSALIRNIYLLQMGALAIVGVALGSAIGAGCPFVLGWLAKDRLPIPVLFTLYPGALAIASAFGLFAAAAFSLLPLARARATPPSAMFRHDLSGRVRPGAEIVALMVSALALIVLTVLSAPSARVATVMLAAVMASFALLWLLGRGAAAVAGSARGLARGPVRIGLANLSGPGSAARTATPAIGLGVALLTAVVLIQSSLLSQIRDVAPMTAPSVIFTQIPPDRAAAFDADLVRTIGALTPDRYLRMPFATGRITALKGRPVDVARIAAGERWAFDRDISLSTADQAPPDAGLIAGHWWAAGYTGTPLMILDRDIGQAAGLGLGDSVLISVLGRPLEARVAGLRKVEFGRFGASFPLILDSAALSGANLRQIAIAKTSPLQDSAAMKLLGRDFPNVDIISVREQLEAAVRLFDQLAWAVRGAASIAALAGLLVLSGAIAASAQARAREAAVLKVLGSTRIQVLTAYLVEYGSVGAIAGTAGVIFGAFAAWPVVVIVFHAHWNLDVGGVLAVLASASILAALGGIFSALFALTQRPAPMLRYE